MSQPYCVFFDIETQTCAPRQVYGKRRVAAMQAMEVSVACALCVPLSAAESHKSFAQAIAVAENQTFWTDDCADKARSMEPLLRLFDAASLICGYNVLDFDFTVLQKHYCSGAPTAQDADKRFFYHRAKTTDLFCRIRDITGHWYKLDSLLQRNGIEQKTGDGLQAVKLWETNQRQTLQDYCAADTRLTAHLSALPSLRLPECQGYTIPIQLQNSQFGILSAPPVASHFSSNTNSSTPPETANKPSRIGATKQARGRGQTKDSPK